MQLSHLSHRLLDLLFPPRCVGCGREGQYLCIRCLASSPRLTPPFCRICAQPIPAGELCNRCRQHPLEIDGVRAPFIMDGVIQEAIHRLKYGHLKALSHIAGRLLTDYLQRNPIPSDIVIPVPLHPRRERERGYNQSALLASTLSKGMRLRHIDKGLVRVKDTPPQAKATNARERKANIAGSFLWKGEGLEGKRVLLLDDVCTTGSTLEACARALKGGGALSVWALVLAREG